MAQTRPDKKAADSSSQASPMQTLPADALGMVAELLPAKVINRWRLTSRYFNRLEILKQKFNQKAVRVYGHAYGHFFYEHKPQGRLWSWGTNYGHLIAQGDTQLPREITFFTERNLTLRRIVCADAHTFYLCTSGELYASGENADGRAGLPFARNYQQPEKVTFFDDRKLTVVQFCAAIHHSLFLCSNGHVYACGLDDYGQLGNQAKPDNQAKQFLSAPIPFFLTLPQRVTKIATGGYYSFALCDNGDIYGWGSSYDGQLACLPYRQESYFIKKTDIRKINYFREHNITIVDIACGFEQTFFTSDQGVVYACGGNLEGALGTNRSGDDLHKNPLPVKLAFFTAQHIKVNRVITGLHRTTFFMCDNNEVYGCGENQCLVLGYSPTLGYGSQLIPKKIVLLTKSEIIHITTTKCVSYFHTADGNIYVSGMDYFKHPDGEKGNLYTLIPTPQSLFKTPHFR